MKKICSLIFALVIALSLVATSYAVDSPSAPIYIDTDLEGRVCPICHQYFTESDDDVVFCPDCDTPYHEHCLDSNGGCIYVDEHGHKTTDTDSGNNKAPDSPKTGVFPVELILASAAAMTIGCVFVAKKVSKSK